MAVDKVLSLRTLLGAARFAGAVQHQRLAGQEQGSHPGVCCAAHARVQRTTRVGAVQRGRGRYDALATFNLLQLQIAKFTRRNFFYKLQYYIYDICNFYFRLRCNWSVFPDVTPGQAGSPYVFQRVTYLWGLLVQKKFRARMPFLELNQKCQRTEGL